AEAQRRLAEVRAGLGALSTDVRRMSHELHPAVIEDLGLAQGLRTLTAEFGEREGMIANVSTRDLPETIPPDVATNLYRIAQEALRNVAKHAGRTHVRVSLRGTRGGLQLQIRDSGEGFDMEGQRSGLGFISMEERARLMHGTLTVQSALGDGVTITVDVPLAAAS